MLRLPKHTFICDAGTLAAKIGIYNSKLESQVHEHLEYLFETPSKITIKSLQILTW